MTISQWADRHRVLDATTSSEGGAWKTTRIPYAREWMDSMALHHVHQVTIKKSTQVGGTETILNVLGYAVTQDPGPVLYVLPSQQEGEEFFTERLLPMVRLCEPMHAQLSTGRHDSKKRRLKFRRCRIRIASARVASDLAQFAARWLIGDECGKWPQWTQREAGPWELALERTATYWNYRSMLVSTPVLDGGLISREFLAGDRRRYYVPCPHCNRYQVLRWQNVKYPASMETEEQMVLHREAWYECDGCAGRIEDRQKQAMLERGVWIPEAIEVESILEKGVPVVPPEHAEHRSYHIWAAYSPWRAWWQLAARWLKWKDQPEQLQNWVNSWLGEEWVQKVEDPRPEMLRECIGGYKRGQVPEGVLVMTAMVDVQKRFLVFTIRGWGFDNESWLIDHGRVDSFEALNEALFFRRWPRNLMVRGVFIDARYRTSEVVQFARQHKAIVRPSIGISRDDPRPFSTSTLDRHPVTGAPLEFSMVAWHVNVGLFKDVLAERLKVGGNPGPGAFHIYEDIDNQYLQEMVSEHKVTVRKGKREVEQWVKKIGHRQNHFWDTEVGNVAIAQLIGVERLRRLVGRNHYRRPPPPHRSGSDEDGDGCALR